jgi:hypothetical protein
VQTARVLNQVNPDFIRVRTMKVLKTMPLYQRIEKGEFVLMTDDEMIGEERLLIDHLQGITGTFVSDHIMNLLQEVEGKLPEEKRKMLNLVDRCLSLPKEEKNNFRLGRRTEVYQSAEDLSRSELRNRVEAALLRIESEGPGSLEEVLSELTESFI